MNMTTNQQQPNKPAPHTSAAPLITPAAKGYEAKPVVTAPMSDKHDNAATPAAGSQEKTNALHAEIKKHWNKLTDDEIKMHSKQPDQFFGKVKEKHGVSKDEAQKQLATLKSSCGCGSEKAA
jgi:uncharacterized protein YjbJ (UPF0337 family)